MVEELNQEHEYRKIAEREIASQDAAYTKLQIKYEDTRGDLDKTKQELEQANDLVKRKEETIDGLKEDIAELEQDSQQAATSLSLLEGQVEDMQSDIKTLTGRLEQEEDTVADQYDTIGELKSEIKTKETELNKLKSDVFGVQEEIKHKSGIITKLEGDITALNKAMEDLAREKDLTIEEKNEELDDFEDKIDSLTRENKEKDADIEALRKENLKCIATIESMRKMLSTRGKEMRALKDITNELLGGAEQDVKAQSEWVARKSATVQQARKAYNAVETETEATTALVQQTATSKTKVTATVRDSGYLGEEDEHTQEGMLLENGH